MTKWYSINDEDYDYSDRDGVLDALFCEGRLEVGTVYYECDSKPLELSKVLNARYVLEQADELGYDLIGETWSNPFSVTSEAEAELQNLLNDWARKHINISNYSEFVGNSKECYVEESDLGFDQ